MLSFQDVTFSYPQSPECAVLSDITLTISPADFFVLVGANGSGKSTFALLCNGLNSPQAGFVSVDGIRLNSASREQLRRVRSLVGLVKQDPETQILSSTVFEEVGFGPCNLGLSRDEVYERIETALQLCNLTALAERNPATLSGGEQQRLVLASVIAMRPHYIVLDEPCAMLDPASKAQIMSTLVDLHKSGIGIILISHDLSDLRCATRVGALSHHHVTVFDDPQEYLMQESLVAQTGCAYTPLMRCSRSLDELIREEVAQYAQLCDSADTQDEADHTDSANSKGMSSSRGIIQHKNALLMNASELAYYLAQTKLHLSGGEQT